jgi:alpha-beta hydrolase superfamily lysophospholipase
MNTSLTTYDGLSLFVQHWPTTVSPARGTVLIAHGLGEHIMRYAHVAKFLNAQGWNVVGYDHRGHGKSGGDKGVLNQADDFATDLALVMDAVRQQYPGILVLAGHSLGGLIAARFVAGSLESTPPKWSRPVDALVLSSPAIDIGMNAAQKMMLSIAEPLTPNLAVNNGLNPSWVSRDPAVVKAYKDDPLVHDRITPKIVRFILDGGAKVLELAPKWTTPTLLTWAGSDKCVVPKGSADFSAAAPKSVVTSREWPKLYHEIFNEPEQGEVLAYVGDWLATKLR